jgi:hypothetical protein
VGPAGQAPEKGTSRGAPPARRERLLLAVLGALLVICAIGLATERIRNVRLEGRVTELSSELETTRATLGAYETRLDEVRGAVERLRALVQRDPAAPAPDSR